MEGVIYNFFVLCYETSRGLTHPACEENFAVVGDGGESVEAIEIGGIYVEV